MVYVYVLVFRDTSLFLQMTVISATFLSKTNPSSKIIVLTDELTDFSLYPAQLELLIALNVEIVSVNTGEIDPVRSSRYIKLTLPTIINETAWYLDGDTLPLVDISETVVAGDLGLVRDLNQDSTEFLINSARARDCSSMDWRLPTYPYYNSGVIYLKNTISVQEVFKNALDLWLSAKAKGLSCGDQLPLNISISSMPNVVVTMLDDSYNAQIRASPSVAVGARILHIFSGSIKKHNDTVLHALIRTMSTDCSLAEKIINNLLKTGNPWLKNSKQHYLFPLRRQCRKVRDILSRNQ